MPAINLTVNGEFSSQEVTASMFSYTPAEFKRIKLKTELKTHTISSDLIKSVFSPAYKQ